MKHLLILLSIVLLNVVTVSGQTLDSLKNEVTEIIDEQEVKPLMHKMYDDIKEALVGLSGALKVGTEHVYKVLVKQQMVNSVMYIILGLISIFLLNNFIKAYKSDEEWADFDNPTGIGVIRVLQAILGLVLCFMSLINIDLIMTGLINPEYGAMKEIISWIKY